MNRFLIAAIAVAGAVWFGALALAQNQMASPQGSPLSFGYPKTTVAGLPLCTPDIKNAIYTVTDASLPSVGIKVSGGGAIQLLVHCNGTIWVVA